MTVSSNKICLLNGALLVAFCWAELPIFGESPMASSDQSKLKDEKIVALIVTAKDTEVCIPDASGKKEAFVAAKSGDSLVDGAYVQTHKFGYAEIAWKEPGIRVRPWGDTCIRNSPLERTVFLEKGTVMFRKSFNSADCTVETKRLLVKVHGTTIRLTSEGDGDRIVVIESNSYVDVYDKAKKAWSKMKPGDTCPAQIMNEPVRNGI